VDTGNGIINGTNQLLDALPAAESQRLMRSLKPRLAGTGGAPWELLRKRY
jgi:hypothetical protein